MMKKLLLLTSFTFLVYHAMSQPNCKPSPFYLTLPPGTIVLTEQNYKDFCEQKFNQKQYNLSERNMFRKDSLLFSYWCGSDNPRFSQTLEQKQKIMTTLLSGKGEFKSTCEFREAKLVTVNSVRFLIIDYRVQDNCFTSFLSEYNLNYEFLFGNLTYKSRDQTNSNKYLQELLASVYSWLPSEMSTCMMYNTKAIPYEVAFCKNKRCLQYHPCYNIDRYFCCVL